MDCLLLLFFYACFLLPVFLARSIVQWQARWYAHFFRHGEQSLDRMQDPLSRLIYGKMSDFVTIGPENPDAFPRAIWCIRLLGLTGLVVTTIILIFWAAASP